MTFKLPTRRQFLKTSAVSVAGAGLLLRNHQIGNGDARASEKNDRPLVGCIGNGTRWKKIGANAMKYGDCVALCDVDSEHLASGRETVEKQQGRKIETYDDYRRVLDRKEIDIVTISTPDHWHTKIAIEAMQAGKDVYCEKPLSLTIKEGQQINQVVRQTKRVFQVGTQQRSEMNMRFLTAIALIRAGRLGKIQRVQCAIGSAPTSGPIPTAKSPSHLNWERWLGQAPLVDYRYRSGGKRGKTRCHYEFRWWYEYSGGKMTDWGAHHVDIAQWAIDQNGPNQGPLSVTPVMAEHPVAYKNGRPQQDDQYNTASKFLIKANFPDDVEMTIRHDTSNGILLEGTKGRIFVSRGSLKGKPVEELADNPLPEDAITKLYKGKQPGDHMRNFFECVKTRELPISDVFSHHRALTTCHLANIAIRLNRQLKWNARTEQIEGDDEARGWQSRQQREGYTITV